MATGLATGLRDWLQDYIYLSVSYSNGSHGSHGSQYSRRKRHVSLYGEAVYTGAWSGYGGYRSYGVVFIALFWLPAGYHWLRDYVAI